MSRFEPDRYFAMVCDRIAQEMLCTRIDPTSVAAVIVTNPDDRAAFAVMFQPFAELPITIEPQPAGSDLFTMILVDRDLAWVAVGELHPPLERRAS